MPQGQCTPREYTETAIRAQKQTGADAMTERRWATELEAADYARISGNTLRRWRSEGRIAGYKISRTVRYDLNELDAAIQADTTQEGK